MTIHTPTPWLAGFVHRWHAGTSSPWLAHTNDRIDAIEWLEREAMEIDVAI